MRFLASLISSTDPQVDSIIVAALGAMLALCLIEGFDVAINHHEFSAIGFGAGAGSILAGLGAGRLMRDTLGKP